MLILAQDQIAPLETPSAGFNLFDIGIGYKIKLSRSNIVLSLGLRNLLNETMRRHTSFLKARAPLPGRAITLGVRLGF